MPFDSNTAAAAGAKSSRKGRPNKETKALRQHIEALLEEQWDQVLEDIKSLSPKERVDTMVKLLEYALPKLNRTEVRETSTVEELLEMSPQERRTRIGDLRRQLNSNQ